MLYLSIIMTTKYYRATANPNTKYERVIYFEMGSPPDREYMRKAIGVDTLEELTRDEYKKAIAGLDERRVLRLDLNSKKS